MRIMHFHDNLKNMSSFQRAFFCILMVVFCLPLGKHANAQQGPVWKTVCADVENVKTCRISLGVHLQKKGEDGKQRVAGRVLALNVLYLENSETKERSPHLSVSVPLGVDIRPGAVLRIDQGKSIPIGYLRCTQSGCDASIKLDDKLLGALKAGSDLFVGFRPWGSTETSALKVSLTGFTKAFNSLT